MPRYARLRTDLVSAPAVVDGVTVYNIKDPATGSYFRLREPEFWLVQQFDGVTDYDAIAERFREKFELNMPPEQVAAFAEALGKMGFLQSDHPEFSPVRTSYLPEMGDSLFARLLFIKIKAFRPGRFLDFLTGLYRPFHHRFWFVLSLLYIALGLGVLFDNVGEFGVDLFELFSLGSVITVLVAIFIVVSLHEFAHVVTCRYYGGEVPEIGFLLLFFQPCFYSDLSDAWLFPKKSHRLAVTWAGPFFQFIVLATACLVWRVTVPGLPLNTLAKLVAIVAWVTVIFNFNPLIKLDGYYLLSDWLDIPNLRQKAFQYFGNALKRRLLGWPIEPLETTPRHRRIFILYASLALVYSLALIAYMLVVFGRFLLAKAGPIGLLLLLALLVLTLRSALVNFVRGTITHIRYMKRLLASPIRLAVYLLIVAMLVILLFVIPAPHRVGGEIEVRPIAEFDLRLNDFGLLESSFRRGGDNPESRSGYLQMTSQDMAKLELVPLVRDGQAVDSLDTLAVISSNQVSSEILAARSELDRLESELALLKAPPKREELDQAQSDVSAARATWEQLTRDLERTRLLAEKNLSTPEKLEAAQSAVDVALAELENKEARLRLVKSPPKPEAEAVIVSQLATQQAKLDFLTSQQEAQSITTPIAGIVAMRGSGSDLLTVVDYSRVEIRIPIADFDIDLVHRGQPVAVKLRSFPGRTFMGNVAHVPKVAFATQGVAAFRVTAVLPNDDHTLLEGMTGYAKIDVGKTRIASLLLRKLLANLRVEFWSWW